MKHETFPIFSFPIFGGKLPLTYLPRYKVLKTTQEQWHCFILSALSRRRKLSELKQSKTLESPSNALLWTWLQISPKVKLLGVRGHERSICNFWSKTFFEEKVLIGKIGQRYWHHRACPVKQNISCNIYYISSKKYIGRHMTNNITIAIYAIGEAAVQYVV